MSIPEEYRKLPVAKICLSWKWEGFRLEREVYVIAKRRHERDESIYYYMAYLRTQGIQVKWDESFIIRFDSQHLLDEYTEDDIQYYRSLFPGARVFIHDKSMFLPSIGQAVRLFWTIYESSMAPRDKALAFSILYGSEQITDEQYKFINRIILDDEVRLVIEPVDSEELDVMEVFEDNFVLLPEIFTVYRPEQNSLRIDLYREGVEIRPRKEGEKVFQSHVGILCEL